MYSINAGTMLVYLAGAAFYACAAMAVYWSVRRVAPGFGLWMLSFGFVGASAILLLDLGHFPRPLTALVISGFILLAAALRFEGLRHYLGLRRLGGWIFLLPAVGVGLISLFAHVWSRAAVGIMVVSAGVALVFLAMTVDSLNIGRRSRPRSLRSGALLFLTYAVLWLVSGIHWLIAGLGFPLADFDTYAAVFLAGATLFEVFGLVGALVLSARWNTEALEAAQGVTEQERRQLADIVSFLPDAIFVLDKGRRVIAWNRAAEERTGIAASEIVGVRVDESPLRAAMNDDITLSEVLLDPSKSVPARYRDVRFGKDTVSGEEEWHHPTAPEKSGHFSHLAGLLRSTDGEITGTIESLRDMTARVKSDEAMRESEERYRSLFDHSLDGILVIAPGGAVADANASACSLLGMTREELCAADPGSLIGRVGLEESHTGQLTEPGTILRQMEFVRGDGSTFPAECVSVVWNDSTGHLRSFVQFRDISERVEAQGVLRTIEEDLTPDPRVQDVGRWEIDLVARSIWLSPQVLRMFGLSGHSPYIPLETSTVADIREQPEILETELRRVMTHGGSFDLEYFVRRYDDGVRRKIHSAGAAVMGPEGAPVRVVGVSRDVTESGDALALPPLDFHAWEHSYEQIYWVDPEGRIVNVNQAACSQLGYSREELLAMTIYELNPDLPEGAADSLDTVKAATARRHEINHRTKDGRDIPVELTVTFASYNDAEYKFVVARDMSERKRLEENLQKTQLSLGQGGDAILWVDENGRLVFATDSVCDKLGFSREEILSMNIQDLEVGASEDWTAVWRELLEQGSRACENAYRTKSGGTIQVDALVNCVRHEGIEYALVVINEMDERFLKPSASSEVDLSRLQHQELEAVGQLAGGIAHDFNNLLTAIIGYGDLILAGEGAESTGALRKDAAEIRNAAERAAVLTNQILAFARRQPLRPRRVDLRELLEGMVPRLEALLIEGVRLDVEPGRETGVVEVDTEQFERVVVNLVTNAQEAMPSGGLVDIGVKNVELSEEDCRAYPELRAGQYVVLSVSDTGVGMDATTRERIFEPFFTTKQPGEGPGLGLSVVYGIVRQSGGYVVAYSEVDEGSTMEVYLPRLSGESVPASPEPAPVVRSEVVGGTILVVEDEPPLRRLMARVLGTAGYRVFVAGSGPEALELIEDMVEPPDLLITDVILPGGLRGNDLASEFMSRMPGLPVLYISGHPRDAIMHEGRLDDGVFFLGKPFTPQELSAKVREIVGGGPAGPESHED